MNMTVYTGYIYYNVQWIIFEAYQRGFKGSRQK